MRVRARVRACVRACVRARVRACVRACVCVIETERLKLRYSSRHPIQSRMFVLYKQYFDSNLNYGQDK